MTIRMRVDPSMLLVFARAVGDESDAIRTQLDASAGEPVTAPLTFTRAVAEHFDDDGELRLWPGGVPTPVGGAPGQFHAEQHFEYFKPLRAGAALHAHTTGGRTWQREGRSGTLSFAEVVTEFVDDDGDLCVRATKVGVRVATPEVDA